MRLLSIILLVLLPTIVMADVQRDQIEKVLNDYIIGIGSADCYANMNNIHSTDLLSAKNHLVPVFAEALKNKNTEAADMAKTFFGTTPATKMDGKGALCGLNAIVKRMQPAIFDIFKVAKIKVDKVVIQQPDAAVEYSLHLGDKSITDMERLSLDGSVWKIRTKESPEMTAIKFKKILQRP